MLPAIKEYCRIIDIVVIALLFTWHAVVHLKVSMGPFLHSTVGRASQVATGFSEWSNSKSTSLHLCGPYSVEMWIHVIM